jgi:hypothetical protein
MISLWWFHKEVPVHYISRYLFKKEVKNIRDYVPNRLSGEIAPYFNDAKLKQVLDNKLYFNLYYSQFGLKLPEIIAFNHKDVFTCGDSTIYIQDVSGFESYIKDLFQQNPDCDALFLKKIYSSSSGKHVYLIPADHSKIESLKLDEIFKQITSSEFVIQKRIKQHPELERLNPSSLNTLRIDTFVDRDKNIDIISGFLKMSTNGLPVDNNTSGGCGVGIDMNTGKLRRNGYSKIRISGVEILTEHTVTGIKFEGFKVPMFEEAKKLVVKAAVLMPGLRLVGWDVGIGENGPVLVEGNSDYGINSNDLMYGGYLANENFKKILREFNQR